MDDEPRFLDGHDDAARQVGLAQIVFVDFGLREGEREGLVRFDGGAFFSPGL